MSSFKTVSVYGRIKPCPNNIQSKEYQLETNQNEDYITFKTPKSLSTKKIFRFRKIFGPHSTQEEVFQSVAIPVIENVLSGYNGTIFTYGQTGSGKTYTMTGDIDKWTYPGLIPRTIQKIFQMKDENVKVSITYCEIYNEHVHDLIRSERIDSDSNNIVNVLEDATGMTQFRNLSCHMVNTVNEAMQLLLRGDANKMVAETASNLKSSRSHVLFSISLEFPSPDQDNLFLKPILYLVDLAGSEKLSKCKTAKNNPWETRYINLSLHYLEQVLLALRQPGRVHIPYRNSLMTALLRNSLGGNCVTSMIATFCISVADLDETVQTCRFAERIALIKNEVKTNKVFDSERELDVLRKENQRLKSQLKLLDSAIATGELSAEDKEKCAQLVRSYIENSTLENLPLFDVKRMEYCLYLMRNEILNPKKGFETNKSHNIIDLFNNFPRSNSFKVEARKNSFQKIIRTESKEENKIWKKKQTFMKLPKVNITFENLTAFENLSGKENNAGDKRASKTETKTVKSATKSPSTETYDGYKKETEYIEDRESEILTAESYFLAKSRAKNTEENYENNYEKPSSTSIAIQHSSESFEPVDKTKISAMSLDMPLKTASSATFALEKDNIKNVEKSYSFGGLKTVLSTDFLQMDDCEIKDQEVDYSDVETPENMSVASKGSSHFSTSYLPLTGDLEVDEEILKFYKARYELLKEQEKK